jgi:hypothetical protein
LNLVPRSRVIPGPDHEEIEIVEGELIESTTPLTKKDPGAVIKKIPEKIDLVATIGTIAIGLLKLFRNFSTGERNEPHDRSRKRRRRG